MILMQLKRYIQGRESVGLRELSRVFSVTPDALEPMLAVWINKGQLRLCQQKSGCGGGCSGCPIKQGLRYQWVDRH